MKEILDRVLTWPSWRQEDAVRMLREMEEQDSSPYRLTDEQLDEVGAATRGLHRAPRALRHR